MGADSTATSEGADVLSFDGRTLATRLPGKPGVYRMLDAAGDVLYVGKAANLSKRVASYFTGEARDGRIATMVAQVAGIEITVTRTEAEALLLENQLIKSLKPRYNVLLRDDKSYPYIYLSAGPYPRLAFHRGAQNMPGEFFGPFPSAYAVRDSLRQMQKLFRVRQCEDTFFKNRTRPCLQYQIKRCTAPCVELISEQDYASDVRHARLFLSGGGQRIIHELVAAMEKASDQLDYERAAEIRDRIATLRKIQAEQHVEGVSGDVDVIGLACTGDAACLHVVFFRQGRNLGDRNYFPRFSGEREPAEIVRAFLLQHYLGAEIPRQLIVGSPLEDGALLERAFSERAGRRVRIISRPRGERAKWLALANANAQTALRLHLASHAGMRRRLDDLRELIRLDEDIGRMECFDISHTQGEATVASCVVFDGDGPVKSDYRRFNINGIEGGDDYAAMRQALERRYKRLQQGEGRLPDLLLIDGGKGQVACALEVLDELQVEGVEVVGVAKGPRRRDGEEALIIDRGRASIRPGPASPGLALVQWIRDEAHRFAITGHRQRRARKRQRSTLEDIPGIGAKRRRALLTQFGGLKGVVNAGVEELSRVDGISEALAQRIYATFHDGE